MKALGLGILKGGLIGGALGFGAYRLGLSGSAWKYLLYGAVGLVVGLIAGRPIWRNLIDKETTVWTSALKGIFGFGVCVGLYALAHHALGDPRLSVASLGSRPLTDHTFVFAPIVGVLWGLLVEIDDALDSKPKPKTAALAKKK